MRKADLSGGVCRAARRDDFLDLLRALAICVVVIYHVIQMSPSPFPHLMQYAKWGQYGVDVFFVLSGWLIGGIFWRGLLANRQPRHCHFWLRRALRTMPPYFAALGLAFGAVWLQRGEPFDVSYLVFGQNYRETIPFFLVSWSLCIEEHFYLGVALLGGAFARSIRRIGFICAALAVGSLIMRISTPDSVLRCASFGYTYTASHLRLDGLLAGFALAGMSVHQPAAWKFIRRHAGLLMAISLGGLSWAALAGAGGMYRYGLFFLPCAVAASIAMFSGRVSLGRRTGACIRWIAITSYSVYLTHALMIHAARFVSARFEAFGTAVYFLIVSAAVVAGGFLFFWGVERPCMRLREHLVPGGARAGLDRPRLKAPRAHDWSSPYHT